MPAYKWNAVLGKRWTSDWLEPIRICSLWFPSVPQSFHTRSSAPQWHCAESRRHRRNLKAISAVTQTLKLFFPSFWKLFVPEGMYKSMLLRGSSAVEPDWCRLFLARGTNVYGTPATQKKNSLHHSPQFDTVHLEFSTQTNFASASCNESIFQTSPKLRQAMKIMTVFRIILQ